MRSSRAPQSSAEPDPVAVTARLEELFGDLAEKWRRDTELLSSVTQMAMHPAYQQIIGMGRPAIPLILRELQQRPDHWFWALNAITGEDPVPPGDGFEEAVEAWLQWGREQGYREPLRRHRAGAAKAP